jgi:hypothetical protein
MKTARQCVIGLSLILLVLLSFSGQVNAQLDSLNKYGGFESDLPSYWMKGKQAGATLSWATDQSRSMGRSLKIVKQAATADSVYWVSENMVDLWSPMINQGVDMLLGAFVRTDSVNTNPSGEDAKWWISYTFWDSTGALIGEVKLPIDQSKASSTDWMADTNQVGQTILPRNARTLIIKFVAGKNATGTVWADDFMLVGRNNKWAGQDWNTSVGVPTGWNYWLPPNGGNDAKLSNGFENTRITSEAAHTGKYSLKFDIPKGTHDAWVGTKRYQLPAGVKAGDSLKISVWVKASNLVPDSAAKFPGQWAVGFTPIFHSGWTNNAKYDEIGSKDTVFTFPAKDTAFDWTQYTLVYPVPNDTSAKAVSIRLHVYSRFQGIVYFDDLNVTMQNPTAVERIGTTVKTFALDQNYPNPFNPSTIIKYSIPENAFVKLRIYDMLGREVATLVNSEQNAGVYSATWNGENNFGAKVSSGTYIYRIEAGKFSQVKKLVLLK